MPLFSREKSLAELEEEEERIKHENSLMERRVEGAELRRRLDEMGGVGFWRKFSDNGKLSGFSPRKAITWLRSRGS